jgi:hypothetical protein
MAVLDLCSYHLIILWAVVALADIAVTAAHLFKPLMVIPVLVAAVALAVLGSGVARLLLVVAVEVVSVFTDKAQAVVEGLI